MNNRYYVFDGEYRGRTVIGLNILREEVKENVNYDGESLLTVKEVANRLGCGSTTVWSLIREKSLPAIRIKGAVRIRPEDIEKFKEQNPY